ncbi:transferrin receptor-like dimerization domain-containing protein [Chitinophaga ginsengisegetis]|uniref:transferrin receptor-like dimerization domain-containing protein n=1 Tax=Chitinophaga ginsengisegetis TaxID=393003 RepID=UPI000DB9FD24|nr:transferrin receptor-like dimerization domain-containing protein [Chitinophaga ginsengisegetis]MDR6566498.1 N-acetylated-alpha-linked acidic dipeptidase [Chitinophaga ginsengisegetis]MDR6646228.1 N-acetylated-alpha-linked acidic dipeptidase [Chitinophaga ginsengisegetis]MDR6651179.1 N-acetylated-alpha-linked acidic dipeptidase [Chitinophaga ginsengisegetis]
MTTTNFSLLMALLLCTGGAARAQDKKLTGYTGNAATQQLELENRFDKQLSSSHIGETIKALSSQPHHIGSARGKAVAEDILQRFKSYGWDAEIVTYQVLFPTPKERLVELKGSTTYKALLKEPALKEDATSGQEGQLPTYNAWSADGDVEGELVYVNYGLPEDYEYLDRAGINVKGKIVIAKYGRSWRGSKPKVAQEHGAAGCIIYSDPKDDGYYSGDVYPKGAFKNEYGVQRGSVMDIVIYPGDPLTPNTGATANAQRLDRLQAPNLLKIPVLPISYHDATPLLQALEGPVAPDEWKGALPFTYHIGGGKARVHLKLLFDWQIRPCYNVIAKLKGSEQPDQWVIRGNHHDAWVNGAADPISGLAALLEEAKAIGALHKQGYQPKRTLVYCAWDGEEPGLLGSTEWVEDHAAELKEKAVVYINSDNNGRGFLNASGSHALETLVNEVARDITDPQTQVSILARKQASEVLKAATPKLKKEKLAKQGIAIGAMGSGSDYSSFLQHLGVPSLDFGFGGEDAGGEYHSIYDSYDDYTRFKDPGFNYGVALSQTAGHTALRVANTVTLPFDYRKLYETVNGYVNELTELTSSLRESTTIENQLIRDRKYQLTTDTAKHLSPPLLKSEVPYLDFSPLQNALTGLDTVTTSLAARKQLSAAANKALYQGEQQLLNDAGLPARSWYKHTLYAPGFYTGYGVKTIPGVREAIEQRRWKEAQEQIGIVAAAINRLSAYLGNIH